MKGFIKNTIFTLIVLFIIYLVGVGLTYSKIVDRCNSNGNPNIVDCSCVADVTMSKMNFDDYIMLALDITNISQISEKIPPFDYMECVNGAALLGGILLGGSLLNAGSEEYDED